MNPIVSGIIPPLLTPLTSAGDIDVDSLTRLIEQQINAGVDGLFVLGSSGEVAFLTDEEREQVIELVLKLVDGRVPVYAGVIDTQTKRVIAHIRRAEALGVQAVVATAPFYAITGPDEIAAHFRALRAATDLPIIAYDIPVCVHTKLAPELLVQLGAEGVLQGVKDSSGDDVSFRRLCALNKAAGSPLKVLTGHEAVVDGAYLAGADGCVPGLGNVDPAGYVRMWRAYQAGDFATMRAEQDRLAQLFEIVFQPIGKVGPAAGVGSFKTALELMGVFTTNLMSPPLAPIDDAPSRDAIADILRKVGVLA
ncbi:dihydrodipicolinate synthase family protein [Corynebacterium epidermidicanis]|uniref:Dihydrodipicolinate synthase/N-acetylneuraminate lyase n=1 Tax=Corynebacterium epidermidicanis TaxID=1050174 RepID=A0A0G3GWE4_9CORY|nr:dihydrodipicolinate synthase family protein [Corynebacterium epidermidicanis]AKK03848.1 dihydrodipicolinate synthase/N-acetylneuraminate lyase [Corynebacterium epidermidicanis]